MEVLKQAQLISGKITIKEMVALSFQLEGGMGLGRVWKGEQGNLKGRRNCFVLQ